ncbi:MULTISPECIES: response regulator transcription factor [unclassified Nocardioides]|uniref:response regulator n=1 Tax=unclassified Nocardioides TaxID=2615069 RepID=UPI0026663130|nr:response regulator transcription factor [Nocardioides sp. Arc9.136]WKN50327.1 response regulator transcription factor [Nocardioides sp. Arc9.136]
MTIRVLVVDDQPLIRGGLLALLAAAPGFEAVGEAADGEDAVRLAAELRPDVVLMDIRMPGTDGVEATRRILAGPQPPDSVKVVVLTTFDLDDYVVAALGAGAAGFLLKDTPPAQILTALQLAAADQVLIAPTVTRRLVESYADRHAGQRGAPQSLDALTVRETEVLQLVGNGLSNEEIATRLVLSESTVKTHVKRVMSKLGLASRAQGVVVAYESGLVVPGGRTTG